MSKSKLGALLAVALIAILASGVSAQDRQRRRERIREGVEAAAGLATEAIQAAEAKDTIHGRVVNLGAKAGNKPREVNVGGLVIVKVEDTGSRPHEDLNVDAGRAFQRLGQVRPANAKPGAGSEWVLLKAVTAGQSTITVTYTPNGGGQPVKRVYTVTITEAEDGGESAVDSSTN